MITIAGMFNSMRNFRRPERRVYLIVQVIIRMIITILIDMIPRPLVTYQKRKKKEVMVQN